MASFKGLLECLLKLLNYLIAVVGFALVGYGIYLFVEYRRMSSDAEGFVELGRPLLLTVSLNGVYEDLSSAWFLYGLIDVGVILLVISCFGCIGIATKNIFCLSCEIPRHKTGDFDMVYSFLKENWDILKWVALGVVVVEALVFLLSLAVRAANRSPEYDSDDEYIAPRQQTRQLMLNKPRATGIPVGTGTVDAQPARDDAWNQYGLNTAEFTYDPSGANRSEPVLAQPEEERSRCTIM